LHEKKYFEVLCSGRGGCHHGFRGGINGEVKIKDKIDLGSAEHIIFEDVTCVGFTGGLSYNTIRRCKIRGAKSAISFSSPSSVGWVISDNDIRGSGKTPWTKRRGPDGFMANGTGVNIYGSGHVVCHNRIDNFSDNLAIANKPQPADFRKHPVNIDFFQDMPSVSFKSAIEIVKCDSRGP